MNENNQKQVKTEQTGNNNAEVAAKNAATYFANNKNKILNNELNDGKSKISQRNTGGLNKNSFFKNNSSYNDLANSKTNPKTNTYPNKKNNGVGNQLPNNSLPKNKLSKSDNNQSLSNDSLSNNSLPTFENNNEAIPNGFKNKSIDNNQNPIIDNQNQNEPKNVKNNLAENNNNNSNDNSINGKKDLSKVLLKNKNVRNILSKQKKELNKQNQNEEKDDADQHINNAVSTAKKIKQTGETIIKIKRTLIIVGVLGGVFVLILLIILLITSSGGAIVASDGDCSGGDDSEWWWPIGGPTDNGNNIYDGEPVYRDTNPSDYGPRDPSIGTSSFHAGVDITVNGIGDPVIATKSGTIKIADYNSSRHNHSCTNGVNGICNLGVYDCVGYGNYVLIDHGDGTQSVYGHLTEVTVKSGDHVEQGELIGRTGSTGISTGAHLHFEIRINDSTKDPLNYISIDNPRPGKKNCIKNGNSLCTGTNGDLISFISSWEGNEGLCTVDGQSGYQSKNLGDGAITLGPGFTNYAMTPEVINYIQSNGYGKYFPNNTITTNMCVPISVFNKVQLFFIESSAAKSVENSAAKYGVNLTQFQKDALTDFNYNQGPAYIDELVSAYASGGYEALWNAMSGHTKGNMTPIKKRLKAEFALFVTGDYSDQGKFYSRNINNYYDYDSEGVMSRKAVCTDGLVRKTRPERDNTFYYSSDGQCGAAGTLEGECAWYGTGRAKEYLAAINSPITWTFNGNGGTFCDSADAKKFKQGTTPKAGSLIVWSYYPYGHVAFVEEVYDDGTFLISEAYIRLGLVTSRSQLHAWGNNCSARKKNCEGNGSGCFHTIKATKSSNSGFKCFVYLDEPK